MLNRILRDPLLWFCLLGGGCFVLYALFGVERTPVVVGEPVKQLLSEEFELLHGRPPEAEELAELVRVHVADEILFHEAIDRGLLINDPKTRQRMVEKMRFMLGGVPDEPEEEDLLDFYSTHYEWYTSERRLSFRHVFFEQPLADADAVATLTALNAGRTVEGDDFWVGSEFDEFSESMLRGMLGNEFVNQVFASGKEAWTGPYASTRGVHFVRLLDVSEPALIPYVEIRTQVARDWINAQRELAINAAVDEVKDRYDVEIEP